MISLRLRNYDVTMRKHRGDVASVPHDLADLPEPYDVQCDSEGRHDHARSDGEEENCETDIRSVSSASASRADAGSGEEDGKTGAPLRSPAHSKQRVVEMGLGSGLCGLLPDGKTLDSYHEPPLRSHTRNAEAENQATSAAKNICLRFHDCIIPGRMYTKPSMFISKNLTSNSLKKSLNKYK